VATCRNGIVTGISVTNGGSGYTSLPTIEIDAPVPLVSVGPNPKAESVSFNAQISANVYDIRLSDDPGTPARSKAFISPSGSLSGALSINTSAASVPATAIVMQVERGDVVVEGAINCDTQTYLMQSDAGNLDNAPYLLTTRSPMTGANTGLLTGKQVGITLGNDSPTPLEGGSLENIVDLDTNISSLRVTAATAGSRPYSGPFPYSLSLRAVSDITIDAVAASGSTIGLRSGGNILLNASLITGAGVDIAATGSFSVSAPISSNRGPIQIVASSLALNNSLRVLDAVSSDETYDVDLTATAGDMSLTGAVSAVNNVRLTQRNKAGVAGKIYGPSRVAARGLSVLAEGSATLLTDVVTLEGRSGGDFYVDERDDITVSSLRAPGFVTLRAGGVDPGENNATSPNVKALAANLVDVTALEASAPKGSIDIVNNTAKTLTLGNFATIGAGRASSMQAAGSVAIRSLASPVIVADAPLGGSSAMAVRVATIANLNAVFAYNTPGTFASTLTNNSIKTALTIDGIAVRVGDRVLIKDQNPGHELENGVYVVTTVGNATTNWKLTRATDADTSAEIPASTFIRVAEGTAAGKTFTIGFTPAPNTSPITATIVVNRADAERTRIATTSVLPGTYNASSTTITASATGSLPLIDGVALAIGDRVLVRLGAATGGAAANGIFEVTDTGSASTKWVLTRALDPTTGNPLTVGYVATTEGTYRAATTGLAFLLSFDSLGNDPMHVTSVAGSGRPVTNIGTEDFNSTTTFVVSSTAGSNDAAGSLGKLIQLCQSNDTSASDVNPNPKTDFRFASLLPSLNGAPAGVIRLAQELPAVTTPLNIDAARRYTVPGAAGSTAKVFVDGSRITTTRTGQSAATATEINGLEFGAGSGAAAPAAGGAIANMTVGGFTKGAAVKVNGAAGIMVNNVTLGRNETGDRLANRFGVLASGNGAEATILGSTIVGSATAGVRVEATATGVTIVGSTIGVANQNNNLGVEILGGSSRVGVNPVSTGILKGTTTLGSDQISLPAGVVPATVFVGQSITGTGIAAGTVISAINGSKLTLSNKMTAGGSSNLTFGQAGRNSIQYNLSGIELKGGSNTVTNTNVNNNIYDGITILDTYDTALKKFSGSLQVIGTSTIGGTTSNAIFANGGWGLHVKIKDNTGKSTLPSPLNLPHKIVGNYFGSAAKATSGVANTLGNVGVNTSLAPTTLGFNPTIPAKSVFVVDKWGNQYVRPSATGATGSIKYLYMPR